MNRRIMNQLNKALLFAMEKHKGQVDKAGKDYINHPVYVALHMHTESAKIVALLHDVLEDTDATVEDLTHLRLSKEQIEAIQLLTRTDKTEPYMDYIRRIHTNPLAAAVKKQDLLHNMDISRFARPTEKDLLRAQKYQEALELLEPWQL
ncbi:MAG: GTP pyrophosphokinase [Lachnospiraceae bacterium]